MALTSFCECQGEDRRPARRSAGIGLLPIPDPRTWPAEIRNWFHDATGECGTFDVFIFHYGPSAAMFLQDAVTALGALDVDISEWHTEGGYPVFVFPPERVGEIRHWLGIYGYTVHILQRKLRIAAQAPVIDIASLRSGMQGAKKQ
jgi:hypothetical protein